MADTKRAIQYLQFLLNEQFGIRTLMDGKSVFCITCLHVSEGINDLPATFSDPEFHAPDCPVRNAIEFLNECEEKNNEQR